MNDIIIVFVFLCLLQLFFIILIRQPKILIHKKILPKSAVGPVKIVLVGGIILLYGMFFISLDTYHKPQPLEKQTYVSKVPYPTSNPSTIKQLTVRRTSRITNYYYLYLAKDKSREAVTATALSLRQTHCREACIIHLYDDKTAFERDIERMTITSLDSMKKWNKMNYVFVADHYLGYLEVVQDAAFAYYPFHDGYYKRAKAGSLEGY